MIRSADSRNEERNSAKKKLAEGEVSFIFVVDLCNEGVDISEVNTILFLRPTDVNGNTDYSLYNFLFEKKVRQDKGWTISSRLESFISELSNNHEFPSLDNLRTFWLKEIKKLMESREGTVKNILQNGKAGFISFDKTTIYFRVPSLINTKQIKQGDKVNFYDI